MFLDSLSALRDSPCRQDICLSASEGQRTAKVREVRLPCIAQYILFPWIFSNALGSPCLLPIQAGEVATKLWGNWEGEWVQPMCTGQQKGSNSASYPTRNYIPNSSKYSLVLTVPQGAELRSKYTKQDSQGPGEVTRRPQLIALPPGTCSQRGMCWTSDSLVLYEQDV